MSRMFVHAPAKLRALAAPALALFLLITMAEMVHAEPAGNEATRAGPAQGETVRLADPDRRTFATAEPSTTNDPWVRMLADADSTFQAWAITPHPLGGSMIVNRGTKGCLMPDITGHVFGYVVQDTCNAREHEVWQVRPTGTDGVVMIISRGGGCLTLPSPFASDARLRLSPCDGIRQGFRLLPAVP